MKKLMNKIKEYLSLQKLAKRTGVNEDRILELEETQCIPGHSYSYSHTESVNCSLKGTYTESTQYTRYYNPLIERWVKKAEALAY